MKKQMAKYEETDGLILRNRWLNMKKQMAEY